MISMISCLPNVRLQGRGQITEKYTFSSFCSEPITFEESAIFTIKDIIL